MLTLRTLGGAIVFSGLLFGWGVRANGTTAIPGNFLDTNEPLTVEFREDASDFFTSQTTVIVLSDGARCSSDSRSRIPPQRLQMSFATMAKRE